MQKRVLIIDDLDVVRKAMRTYICPRVSATDLVAQLIEKGTLNTKPKYEIDEAAQGIEGVEMCRKALEEGRPYDVIFVDMMMPPGISGKDVIELVREFDKEVEIVVWTGLEQEAQNSLSVFPAGYYTTILDKSKVVETDLAVIMEKVVYRPKKGDAQ